LRNLPEVFAAFLGLAVWAVIIYGVWRLARGRAAAKRASPKGAAAPSDHDPKSLVVPRNVSNGFTVATKLRDEIFDKFLAVCARAPVEVVAYKSPVLQPPVARVREQIHL